MPSCDLASVVSLLSEAIGLSEDMSFLSLLALALLELKPYPLWLGRRLP